MSRSVATGDMNDTPASAPLAPLAKSALGLVNALPNPVETRPAKEEAAGANLDV